jgi:hypothetical protein
VKIALPPRKIDIDEYRDFASYKSISSGHRRAIMRADTRHAFATAASCMFIQSLLLFIALVAEMETDIISVGSNLNAIDIPG